MTRRPFPAAFLGLLLVAAACDSKTLKIRADGGRSVRDGATGVDLAPLSQPPVGGLCPDGYAPCGSSDKLGCYDMLRSPDHCGACANACPSGIACEAGVCQQHGCKGPLSFKTVVFGPEGYVSALGDFDGDGIPDLVALSTPFDGFGMLWGLGDGTFAPGPTIGEVPTIPDGGPYFVGPGRQAVAADVDGDGVLDLVTTGSDENALHVRRGLGNRTAPFAEPTTYPTAGPIYQVLLNDFDGDGRLDMVAGEEKGLELWRGREGGQFEPPTVLDSRDAPVSPAIYYGFGIIWTADWNSDGVVDLVYGNGGYPMVNGGIVLGGGPRVHYRLGHGDGTFDAEVVCALTLGIVGDFDDDHRPDMISSSSTMGATLSMGISGCSATKVVPITDWTKQGGVALADFNGDGNLDVVIDDNMAIMVHVGDGKGGFPHALTIPAPSVGDWPIGSFLVGDLNRDGKLDIVFARSGGWGVLLNTCQ